MSNIVNTFPCCYARLKLKEHKSAPKVLHGTIMAKPAQPVIVIAQIS